MLDAWYERAKWLCCFSPVGAKFVILSPCWWADPEKGLTASEDTGSQFCKCSMPFCSWETWDAPIIETYPFMSSVRAYHLCSRISGLLGGVQAQKELDSFNWFYSGARGCEFNYRGVSEVCPYLGIVAWLEPLFLEQQDVILPPSLYFMKEKMKPQRLSVWKQRLERCQK